MYYNYTVSNGVSTITLVGNQGTQVIPDSHPKFNDLARYLSPGSGNEVDENEVWEMVNHAAKVVEDVSQLSERTTYRHGALFFDGDLIDNSLTRHILRMIDAGEEDYNKFVLFLENIALNPSKISRLQLFRWLTDRDFTITEDGNFLGYKGVNHNNTSINSGKATVDGVEVTGYIPNFAGSTIEMPRSLVDPERATACSTGLHVGTWEYASDFGSKTLLVEVNPRDVVSVPSDCNDQKIRCCRYTVLEDAVGFIEEPTWAPEVPAEDDFYVRDDFNTDKVSETITDPTHPDYDPWGDDENTCDECDELESDCDCNKW